MEFVNNNTVLQLLFMYFMIVISAVVTFFQLVYTAFNLKEGIWSIFRVTTRNHLPDKARSERYGTHGFASLHVILYNNCFTILLLEIMGR